MPKEIKASRKVILTPKETQKEKAKVIPKVMPRVVNLAKERAKVRIKERKVQEKESVLRNGEVRKKEQTEVRVFEVLMVTIGIGPKLLLRQMLSLIVLLSQIVCVP